MEESKLKTKYRFIYFSKAAPVHTNPILWICHNNRDKSVLGTIEFYKPWRQHVIDFKPGCVFNSQCLRDITNFLEQLNK